MDLICNVGRRTKSRAALLAAFLSLSVSAWAQISPCDLNTDGVIDSADVTLAVNMALGTASCTANIEGHATCTVVTVQRVINASQGRACIAYNLPSITSATQAGGTVGTAFSYQITATNAPTSYSATGLPTGLSINAATGLISGTPTSAGTSTVTLGATSGGGTGSATLTLAIAAAGASPIISATPAARPSLSDAVSLPPSITSPTSATGTIGAAFSYQITATNSPTSYHAPSLPAGLSVNTATGLISGTPTTMGTSTVTLKAANKGGTGTATLTLTVTSTSGIALVQVTAGAASGTASTFSLAFPNNTVAGNLIVVGFDFNTNAFSSITDSQGNTLTEVASQLTCPGSLLSRVYYASNIKGGADTITINLSANSSWIEVYLTEYSGVNQANPIDAQAGATGNAGAVSSGTAATTAAGDLIYGYCISGTCKVGSGFTVLSRLDSNLLEEETAGSPGPYAATGTANGGWTMQMVALKPASSGTASAPAITSATSASGTVGTAFSYQIAATNTPTSYSATGLPAGLSVSTTTGLISGTPTTAATSTVTLGATNGGGTGHATLTLTIAVTAPAITSATSATGTVGTAFSYQIAATNTPTSYSATGLPAGLSVSTTTGLISGTPTAAATSTVTLRATNAGGSGSATLTLTIAVAAPAITSATSANGTVGTAFSYQIVATNSPTSYSATGLPAGLSVSTTTGLISGTPTAAATSTVTLRATNGGGTRHRHSDADHRGCASGDHQRHLGQRDRRNRILLSDRGHQHAHQL